MLVLFAASGFFGQATGPPLFEASAEMTFPLAENTSGGVLSDLPRLLSVLSLLRAPQLSLTRALPASHGQVSA